MWENADQNNSEHGHFLHSDWIEICVTILKNRNLKTNSLMNLQTWGMPLAHKFCEVFRNALFKEHLQAPACVFLLIIIVRWLPLIYLLVMRGGEVCMNTLPLEFCVLKSTKIFDDKKNINWLSHSLSFTASSL